MNNLKISINKVISRISADKKSVVIIIIGIVGVILLVISELVPGKTDEPSETDAKLSVSDCADYEKSIEERLESLISQINGAGAVRVMVTLDSTAESVYAQEEKESGGENRSFENQYVIIKNENGEEAILIKTTRPQVRGVAVVCSGGGSAVVRQNITDTLTAVLGISSARVSITAMKSSNGG